MIVKILFWSSLLVILYTYFIYTFILALFNLFSTKRQRDKAFDSSYEPEVTLLIPAYNEIACIQQKTRNSAMLDYPKEKLKQVWVTDGSDDGSYEMLSAMEGIVILHKPEREGKIEAMNRAMNLVDTPIALFSDANTDLSTGSIREIVALFSDNTVGCVAGEKRIYIAEKDKAVNTGEGFYWRYESLIKRLESNLGSTMGAAGELFAVRSDLYEQVDKNTILDDFTISLKIARKGFKIKYSSEAHATETASLNVNEEMKRKIRIASGGFQVLFGMPGLLNVFRYGMLSFQYISHKVLRWLVVPWAFLMLFITNLYLVFATPTQPLFLTFFLFQVLFYLLVAIGFFLRNRKIPAKALFFPYYLMMMNVAIIRGLFRFFSRRHTSLWEKVRRG